MMSDTIFTFGQRGSHFLQCPSHKEHTRLPRRLVALVTSPQLFKVHHVALGSEDSFLITWRDKDGNTHVDYSGLPQDLIDFVCARNSQGNFARNVANIRCSLGPYNSSFIVHDGGAYLWMNLPEKLLSALQSRIKDGQWVDQPRIVALGADNNFAMITEKNTAIWELGHYKTILNLLSFSQNQKKSFKDIHNVFLHPYRYESSITQSRNDSILYNNLAPHSIPGMQKLIEEINTNKNNKKKNNKNMNKKEEKEWTPIIPIIRKESDEKNVVPKKSSALQERAKFRKDWDNHSHEISTQARGFKLSLSLKVNVGGLAKMLG